MRNLALLLLLAAACSAESLGSRAREIVRGSVSEAGAHPATVYLWLGGGSCSGTLITPKIVLTAKHCLQGTSTGTLGVFFGNDADGQGTWVDVEHYAVHPSGDIAILTMVEPGPTAPIPVSAVPLGSEHLGMPVLLVGFGDTGGAGGAGVKREGMTTLEDLDGDIMYVGSQGAKTCYGDSGGPTFIDWEGVRHVAGVSSFITQQNCASGSSGNVRTDVYIDWIQEYVAAHDPALCGADGQCASACDAVDPDCPCAGDGFCTTACADNATDPDCDGCEADGLCRADCPALDTDCCAADGACNDACGDTDPDCMPPDDGGGDGGGGGGNGGGGADETDLGLTGGCAVGRSQASPWALLLVALALLRTRRRR